MGWLHARALLGGTLVLTTAGVQAQSLPDFTAIVEKNAPAVVHVEAKTTGRSGCPAVAARASTSTTGSSSAVRWWTA